MRVLETVTRISLKNILYTTDFSPTAEAAAPYASELAKRYGAKVIALHVRPVEANGMVPPEAWAAVHEANELQAKQQAGHLKALFRGVENEVEVTEGAIWDEISRTIEEKKVDLLVTGTHSREGLGKMVMGSHAENILRHSPVPVLVVGPYVRSEPETTARMKRILFATDFSEASLAALPHAISLAEENQAELDILRVVPPQKSGELVNPSDLMDATVRQMKHLVPMEAEAWCKPYYLAEVGEPAPKILQVAELSKADLIVLGVKRVHRALGVTHIPWTIAHKIIAEARCPVLTVRS
ncbi:MAG TPA: universal stress protein [Candidatus Dormibacteraeota bacterium]|nr:universal stress protein [Candidatus Dormibacteraeota bacterium]